jgi:nicotinate-nucleotide adenylyltransferase
MNTHSPSQHIHTRIGLFGGTFDPIHNGHWLVAMDVLQQFKLDKIHFIPCALQPNKTNGPIASASDRVAMLKLALRDQPRFEICEFEIQRQGPSYTIDTLNYFASSQPSRTRLHFIIGIDAFLEIDTWKSYSRLFELASFIVMTRPGIGKSTEQALRRAADYARQRISSDYQLDSRGSRLLHPAMQPIHLTGVSQIDIASTRIRHQIQQGNPIGDWTNKDVAGYIETKGLYR